MRTSLFIAISATGVIACASLARADEPPTQAPAADGTTSVVVPAEPPAAAAAAAPTVPSAPPPTASPPASPPLTGAGELLASMLEPLEIGRAHV